MTKNNVIPYGKAICYSGYRKGQSPVKRIYPTYEQVLEDLRILEKDFDYIRMYDASEHARTACEVISKENIKLKVMLGMDLLGEISNPNCSWGGTYTDEEIARNIDYNQNQLYDLINLANEYRNVVLAVSAGNESVPEWNENLVDPGRVLYFVKKLKENTSVPVSYCDNYFYWQHKLKEVAKEVDFISIHSYPVWTGTPVVDAVNVTITEYRMIDSLYPDKQVLITETGWPTTSNDGEIKSHVANEVNQVFFNNEIDKWSATNNIPCFFFEAFDEKWKGSDNPVEPEKHWGYYFDNRTPKQIKNKENSQ